MRIFVYHLVFIFILWACFPGYAQTDPKALFEAGVDKYKEGEYQAAVDLFTQLIIIAPDSAKALKNRGVALMNLGKMDEAISDFTKAIDLDPDLKGLYVNLGAAWHYKGAYEKAVKTYDKAVEEDPSRALTYYNRGISKMLLKDLTGAVADFEKSLALDPKLDAPVYARQEAQKRLAAKEGTTYAVQTGAFHVKANAVDNQNMMTEKGFDARIIIFKDGDKKTWYLVRCGNGLSRENANQLKTELKNLHGIDSFVRPEHSL